VQRKAHQFAIVVFHDGTWPFPAQTLTWHGQRVGGSKRTILQIIIILSNTDAGLSPG
jgi:hypothetical protein